MFGLQKIVARAPKTISFNLTNMVANRNMGVLSNVPGPTGPMSLAGEEVAGMVGWVPTSGDQSISACILSYNGHVFIGLTTDDSLIADPGKVAHHITEELASVGLRKRPSITVRQVQGEEGQVSP
jgi:diacylglycerol O-acyltransferase / wax synthase